MRTLVIASAALLSFQCCAQAQEGPSGPTPPPELAKFDRLLGTFKGTGSVWMAAGPPAMKWTSRARCKKALNDFTLVEETTIDLGEGVPPLLMASFRGYDPGKKQFKVCEMSNMGAISSSVIHWAGNDTMVSVNTSVEGGEVVVDRWVTELAEDSYTFTGHRAVGGADFFVHVKGTMERTDEPFKGFNPLSAKPFNEVAMEMEKLNRIAGQYTMRGTYRPTPGTEIQISGEEQIIPLFGGGILGAHVKGDPIEGMGGAYEAYAAFAWDPAKGCYASVYVNNMGEIGDGEIRIVGDKLISTHVAVRMGQPALARGVMDLAKDGAITKVVSHGMIGANEPTVEFEATYTRSDG